MDAAGLWDSLKSKRIQWTDVLVPLYQVLGDEVHLPLDDREVRVSENQAQQLQITAVPELHRRAHMTEQVRPTFYPNGGKRRRTMC